MVVAGNRCCGVDVETPVEHSVSRGGFNHAHHHGQVVGGGAVGWHVESSGGVETIGWLAYGDGGRLVVGVEYESDRCLSIP